MGPKNSQKSFQKVLKPIHEDIFRRFHHLKWYGKSYDEAQTLFSKMQKIQN